MQIDGSNNDGAMSRLLKREKDVSSRLHMIMNGNKLSSIIADGKVTLEEARSIGLNSEYDVSTEEGLDAFMTAYKTLQALKNKLENENPQEKTNPKFGLD